MTICTGTSSPGKLLQRKHRCLTFAWRLYGSADSASDADADFRNDAVEQAIAALRGSPTGYSDVGGVYNGYDDHGGFYGGAAGYGGEPQTPTPLPPHDGATSVPIHYPQPLRQTRTSLDGPDWTDSAAGGGATSGAVPSAFGAPGERPVASGQPEGGPAAAPEHVVASSEPPAGAVQVPALLPPMAGDAPSPTGAAPDPRGMPTGPADTHPAGVAAATTPEAAVNATGASNTAPDPTSDSSEPAATKVTAPVEASGSGAVPDAGAQETGQPAQTPAPAPAPNPAPAPAQTAPTAGVAKPLKTAFVIDRMDVDPEDEAAASAARKRAEDAQAALEAATARVQEGVAGHAE